MDFNDGILKEHNKRPYESIVRDLDTYGKACAIHATGTGKMYLAIKWLSDNKSEPFTFFAPTLTILNKFADLVLKTFFEDGYKDLARASIEEKLEVIKILLNNNNINLITYQKLNFMSDEEIKNLTIKNVVTDEFHHLGAEKWGNAIERLFAAHEDYKLLGLSATPIRPSDGQNMVELLFDGRISSIIDLEEAIGKILPTPLMFYGIYSFKEQIDQIEEKLSSKLLGEEARASVDKKIKEARKIIEKAEGIQEVFSSVFSICGLKKGKLIVFCASIEDMKNKIKECQNWFPEGTKLKISCVSSDENYVDNARVINSFEKESFDGIDLLFSVNMLNEGIHVENLDGVVMLRPTNSNIVFLQQLGRALAVNNKSIRPLVFDLVNNVEVMKKDMEQFREMMNSAGFGEAHEKENFVFELHSKIIDIMEYLEIVYRNYNSRQIREDIFLEYCKDSAHPTLANIKLNEKFNYQGKIVNIGNMIEVLRAQYKLRDSKIANIGKIVRALSDEEVEFFEKLDIKWVSDFMTDFDKKIEIFKKYCETNNIEMKDVKGNIVYEGYPLGTWISQFRKKYRSGTLTDYEKEKLEEIGLLLESDRMVSFDKKIEILQEYCDAHEKNLSDVKVEEVYKGYKIGDWIVRFIKKYKIRDEDNEEERKKYGTPLSDKEVEILESLGIVWDKNNKISFQEKVEVIREYLKEYGTIGRIKRNEEYKGYRIGDWFTLFRTKKNRGKLDPKEEEVLNSLGMVWKADKSTPLDEKIRLFKEWQEETGKEFSEMFYDEIYKGYPVGVWASVLKSKYKNRMNNKKKEEGQKRLNSLTDEELEALSIFEGFFESRGQGIISRKIEILEEYNKPLEDIQPKEEYKGKPIGVWIKQFRYDYRDGKLSSESIKKLELMGMVWEKVLSFEQKLEIIQQYCQTSGKTIGEIKKIEFFGKYNIGEWLSQYRDRYRIAMDIKSGKDRKRKNLALTDEEIEALEKIGMAWEISKKNPENIKFRVLYEYFKENGTIANIKQKDQYNGFPIGNWISQYRCKYSKDKLDDKTIEILEKMKMVWIVKKM